MKRKISHFGLAGLLSASLLLAGCSDSGELVSQGVPGKGSLLVDLSEPTDQILEICGQASTDRLTFAAAAELIQASGYTARLVSLDGEAMMGTMDVRMDRVNLFVENGVVIGCTFG